MGAAAASESRGGQLRGCTSAAAPVLALVIHFTVVSSGAFCLVSVRLVQLVNIVGPVQHLAVGKLPSSCVFTSMSNMQAVRTIGMLWGPGMCTPLFMPRLSVHLLPGACILNLSSTWNTPYHTSTFCNGATVPRNKALLQTARRRWRAHRWGCKTWSGPWPRQRQQHARRLRGWRRPSDSSRSTRRHGNGCG